MKGNTEINLAAIQDAKNNLQDFIDPATNEVQLTELGEWLTVEYGFEEGDETPFEIAFDVAQWWDRMLKSPSLAIATGYAYLPPAQEGN